MNKRVLSSKNILNYYYKHWVNTYIHTYIHTYMHTPMCIHSTKWNLLLLKWSGNWLFHRIKTINKKRKTRISSLYTESTLLGNKLYQSFNNKNFRYHKVFRKRICVSFTSMLINIVKRLCTNSHWIVAAIWIISYS